jgi:hypothetical protein
MGGVLSSRIEFRLKIGITSTESAVILGREPERQAKPKSRSKATRSKIPGSLAAKLHAPGMTASMAWCY